MKLRRIHITNLLLFSIAALSCGPYESKVKLPAGRYSVLEYYEQPIGPNYQAERQRQLQCTATIENDTITFVGPNQNECLQYRINEFNEPKHIDLAGKGEIPKTWARGVYQIENDIITISSATSSEYKRPNNLKLPNKGEYFSIVIKLIE